MDAKSKANFINSVAEGQAIPCPKCGKMNKPGSKYCLSCGAEIDVVSEIKAAPAFAPVTDRAQQSSEKTTKYVEPVSVFADGLPSWDVVPPQVMVRRH